MTKPNPAADVKVLARNKRARHEYHVDEMLEAGLVLAGSEVKSIRAGKVTLVDAFADIDKGEAWLHQMDIGVYAFSHGRNHDPRSAFWAPSAGAPASSGVSAFSGVSASSALRLH